MAPLVEPRRREKLGLLDVVQESVSADATAGAARDGGGGGALVAFVDPHCEQDQSGVDPSNPMSAMGADRAIQVLGGYGYVSEYHVERLWRDAKLLEIGGGTIEAHQKNMVRDLAAFEKIL